MVWKKEEGQAMVEFALVLPLLLVLLFGIIDFGWLFYNKIAINNASREGARYAVVHCGDFGYNDEQTKLHVKNYMPTATVTISSDVQNITVTVKRDVEVLTGVSQVFIGETVPIQASCTMRKE